VQADTPVEAERYQGLGGNPNTATMLLAVAVPVAAAFVVGRRRAGVRLAAGIAIALFVASIVASASRGAMVAACAGAVAFALLALDGRKLRVLAAGGAVAALAVGIVVSRLPDSDPSAVVVLPGITTEPARTGGGYLNAERFLRLEDDVGHPPFGVAATESEGRPLLGSSGRSEAWEGALRAGSERPILGFGFGTEEKAFVDRYVGFDSDRPENSYLGLYLQLGLAGVGLFLALAATLALAAFRDVPRLPRADRHLLAACAGVLAAALVLGLFQSYIYSVGNNATVAVWLCLFLLASAPAVRSVAVPA
jgi:O-antigen ligase